MAWLFGGGRENDHAQEEESERDRRLIGKDLEIVEEIVRKSLAADHEMIERYSIIPSIFSSKR